MRAFDVEKTDNEKLLLHYLDWNDLMSYAFNNVPFPDEYPRIDRAAPLENGKLLGFEEFKKYCERKNII